MTNEEKQGIELGDIISLDDENGELLGDFEVIALFDHKGKQYVALTNSVDEDNESEEDEELDIFVFEVDGEELVPLDEGQEEEIYEKLDEVLEDIELIEPEDK
ncbi:DUF1292 domain-containing protein [Brevibacillus fluminis]|uniref:DUF1292 domain-containing protein n=1 Tax=Brevibacillus fluminis TaxID=511487 RepID=A0A3M8DW18_9BACL|nr:DUF1292 domain-containing protein [Brevibacillus fluminis]RNB91699.1 DUF1292 domain-containing protein [Brevibacillus fluminis]